MSRVACAVLAAFLFSSASLSAQEYQPISEKYTCAKFGNGTSAILINGTAPGSYSFTSSGAALKEVRAEKRAARERSRKLKDLKGQIRSGTFDKKDQNYLVSILKTYFPSDTVLSQRASRLAAADKLIQELTARAAILADIEQAISQCAKSEPSDKSAAKYGKVLPVVVNPVFVPGSAAFGNREAYAGYLVSIAQDPSINNERGQKVGTRSGYTACMKNLTTGATFYRIFDDQPCEEVEGGETGGNSSLPFADLAACKQLVPTKTWATFGGWYPISPPTQANIDSTMNFVLTRPGLYKAVIMSADPVRFDGSGVSLDKFKSWCASQSW